MSNKLKKILLSFALIGNIATSTCTIKDTNLNDKIENLDEYQLEEYNHLKNYYIEVMADNKLVKLYDIKHVYFYFNKNNTDVIKTVQSNKEIINGLYTKIEVYDLDSKKLISYSDGKSVQYDMDYYYKLQNDYEVICLDDIDKYIDIKKQGFYTIEKINEFEELLKNKLQNKKTR